MERRLATVAILLLAWPALNGCERPNEPESKKAAVPAKVEKVPGEADLTTVHLSEEAEGRLRIATSKVERRPVGRVRTYGGEVIVPPGHAVTVSAPFNGTVLPPARGKAPMPGATVKKGQEVFRLLPLLSPEAQATLATTRVEAQGQVDQAQKQLAQAKIQLDRAERLRRDNLGGSGALADAQAQYDIAESTLRAAVARRDALDKTIKGIEGGTLDPLSIAAEADGSIKGIHVMPGQAVAAGAMLFDVEELDPIWVRVPVYVGDRRDLDPAADAGVGDLAGVPGEAQKPARPVDAPALGRSDGGHRQSVLRGGQCRPCLLARPAGRSDRATPGAGRGPGRPASGGPVRLPRRDVVLREDGASDLLPTASSRRSPGGRPRGLARRARPRHRRRHDGRGRAVRDRVRRRQVAKRRPMHDLARLDVPASPGAGAGPVGRADGRRRSGGPARPARRLPRVRPAAGRDPDRGAGALDRGGREPRHACRWRTPSTARPG